jgi:hypothetical protein
MLELEHLIGASCFRQLWLKMKRVSRDIQYLVHIDKYLTAVLAPRTIHTGEAPSDVCAVVEWRDLNGEARAMYKDYTFPLLVCWDVRVRTSGTLQRLRSLIGRGQDCTKATLIVLEQNQFFNNVGHEATGEQPMYDVLRQIKTDPRYCQKLNTQMG